MRTLDLAIIHCSDTPNLRNTTVIDIDNWHRARGFKRSDEAREAFNPKLTSIGYHYVIYIDGSLHTGRSLSEIGAHAEGYNAHSIGICMVGCDRFTEEQWVTLHELLTSLQDQYPDIKIKGHYQVANNRKSCPNFNIPVYIADCLIPAEENVWRG